MKELLKGEVAELGIGYEGKIEDGKLKISAELDIVKLIEKGEAALPEGRLKPFEVMLLEMLKGQAKAL